MNPFELPMTEEALLIEEFLTVIDKNGRPVPFTLNSAQRQVDAMVGDRNLVPKARQEGVSTYVLARAFIKCLLNENFHAVVISHEKEATRRLLNRVHNFIKYFPERTGREVKTSKSSVDEISFSETGSSIYIGTAGSRAFGRGDTIQFFHGSEYAYWENGLTLLNGILDALVEGGEAFLESTGQGVGNDYHSRCMQAAAGNSSWNLIFLPWHTFDEYKREFRSEEQKEEFRKAILASEDDPFKEKALFLSNQLTLEQLFWRRRKLEDKNYRVDLFEQEYPMDLDEAFQAGGVSIFRKVNYVKTNGWKILTGNLSGLDTHPMRGRGYIIGADPSGGVGNDNAVAEILDIMTGEQVAEFVSDVTQPDVFGRKLRELGKLYNMAYIGVESNNHGPVTLDNLRGKIEDKEGYAYPLEKIYDSKGNQGRMAGIEDLTLMDLGIRTTARSKPILIGQLNRALASNEITIHSALLKNELATFIENEHGKLEAAQGCHDDAVMALAVANAIRDRALMFFQAEVDEKKSVYRKYDPFSFESIFEGRGRGEKLYGMHLQNASSLSDDNMPPPMRSNFEH